MKPHALIFALLAVSCSAAPVQVQDPVWEVNAAVYDGDEYEVIGAVDVAPLVSAEARVEVAVIEDGVDLHAQVEVMVLVGVKLGVAVSCVEGFCEVCLNYGTAQWCHGGTPVEIGERAEKP